MFIKQLIIFVEMRCPKYRNFAAICRFNMIIIDGS